MKCDAGNREGVIVPESTAAPPRWHFVVYATADLRHLFVALPDQFAPPLPNFVG
jgi:hypothetical protein